MKRNILYRFSTKRLLPVLLVLGMLLSSFPAYAETSAGAKPEASSESDTQSLHVGDTHEWKPFVKYPQLQVTYRSSDPEVLRISADGLLTALKEGEVTVTATSAKTAEYASTEYECLIYVFSSADGLCLSEACTYFYYQGKKYESGKLPLDVERELCLTQPDLKIFLQDYLAPWQERIPDRTEAALTAIINYGANYFRYHIRFEDVGGLAEGAKEDWMRMLVTRKGVCTPHSSMFCYLMYLAGLPSMIVETPEPSDERAHDWNLIEHDGYYYNLENHVFLQHQYDRYICPPFSNATAAYFPGHIYGCWVMHYPVSGGAFGPDKKVNDMGRDLSQACPILICEKKQNGEYIAHFETIRKDDIPVYEDGTPVRLEEVIYRSMETGDGMEAEGPGNQINEAAAPFFTKADHMLFGEIVGMFKTLVLPASLTRIDAEAFTDTAAEYVVIPDSVTEIADGAFAGGKVRALFGNTDAVREYAKNNGLNIIETGLS